MPTTLARRSILTLFAICVLIGGCGSPTSPSPTVGVMPVPTCGGIKVGIAGALSCQRVAAIAIDTLQRTAPQQVARGVTAIDVQLAECPRGEVPPQIDCGAEQFAQLVTVTFGPARPGGPIEPSLTVAIGPASGRVLGISNPLIR